MSKSYRTKNLILMWGTDFGHVDAETDYRMMDKIIQDQSSNTHYKMIYSTLDKYFRAVQDQAKANNIVWPVMNHDFWQYNQRVNKHSGYWTGYFTTDPELKRQISSFSDLSHAHFQMTNLYFLSRNEDLSSSSMNVEQSLSSTLSVLLHHDAITGTSVPHTRLDYMSLMAEAGV